MKKNLLFLCALLFVIPFFAAETQKRSADEAFTESHTGLVFPGQFGCFSKKRVRINKNIVIGTNILYENDSNTVISIFVYKSSEDAKEVLDNKAFAQECAAAEKRFLQLEQLKENSSPLKPGFNVPEKVFYRRYQVTSGDFFICSHLMMFQYKGMIVKCHVSYPAKSTSEYDDVRLFEQSILKQANFKTDESVKKN